jgi:hypothetical protein
VGKKIYKRLVQYLQAREQALGEPAVTEPTASTGPVPGAPVAVSPTRNGVRKDDSADATPPAVRLPHPALRRTR